jgi:large subunit ribosomal protein L10
MNREEKAVVIDEIATNITDAQAIFAVDFRGITVPQAADLRAKLRAADASFRVVKNSLTERAADQAGVTQLKELLAGPTALTFVRGDAATAAKAIADYARLTQKLAFKGGVMDGITLAPEQVTAISRLPSRNILYGQLVGLVASPITGLARTLNALIGGLAVALGGVLEQKESGEIPAGDPPASMAAPAEEPAPAADAPREPVETPVEDAPVVEPIPAEGAEEPVVVPTTTGTLDETAAPSHEIEGVPTTPEPTPTEPLTPSSGDEVAGAESAPAGEAQAESAAADAAPANEEPTSHKENT